MTAADFRSTATGTLGGGTDPTGPPEITSLTAADGSPGGSGVTAGDPVSFHPNGDGIDDTLVLTHTVTKAAYLDATVTDAAGQAVRSYSVWSTSGTSTSEWNGKNDAGTVVPDGLYSLTYVPRDSAGQIGSPVSVDTLVLTAIKLGLPSTPAFYARDADALAKTVKFGVTVTEPAQVSWQIVALDGTVVRTVAASSAATPETLKFTWDGTTDSTAWAPDGWYRSVVTATTELGTYSQERLVYAGAFKTTPSIASPTRGGAVTLVIVSTESLSGAPVVHVSQPGLAPWDAMATRVSGKRYSVTLTLAAGGDAGTLDILVAGTDKYGGTQQSSLSLPLR
jgi:flagellar hook assembly protein FlgD